MFETKLPGNEPLPFAMQRRLYAVLIGLLFAGVIPSVLFLHGETRTLVGALAGLFSLIPARPTVVSAGADGLLLRWWWREAFLPMRRLHEVRPYAAQLAALVLDEPRRELRVALAGASNFFGSDRARATWLERIRKALAAYRVRVPASDHAPVLGQGERTHAEWVAALRRLRDGDAGYRDAKIPGEELWKVVEDPGAHADVRAGAALVLHGSLDPSGQQRVRVAAQATASPQLRVALERTAEAAGDDMLEAALADVAFRRARLR